MTKSSSGRSSQSQDCSSSLGVARVVSVIMLDNSDDDIMNVVTLPKAKNTNAQIQSIVICHKDKHPKDLDIQQAMLKSSMSNALSKNASAREISLTPEQLLAFFDGLNIE